MGFKYFIFIILVFITCSLCDGSTEAAEPSGCSKFSEILTNLSSKVDNLHLQQQSLQLTIKDEKQLMMKRVDHIGEKMEALRVSQLFYALKANLTLDLQELNTKYTKDMQLMLNQINKISQSVCSVILCEGSWGHLTCPSGQRLSIESAIYGRSQDGSICPNQSIHDTSCRSSVSDHIVKSKCNGANGCSIQANNGVYGDPCGGTHKYLEDVII